MSSPTRTAVYSTSSAPISIRHSNATPLTADQKQAQENFVSSQMKNDEIAQLRAESKRINDALRAASAAKKAERTAMQANQPSKLERVIKYQQTYPKWVGVAIAKMVLAREDAGQDRETAMAAVMVTVQQRTLEGITLLESEAAAQAAMPAEPVSAIAASAPVAPKASNGKKPASKTAE